MSTVLHTIKWDESTQVTSIKFDGIVHNYVLKARHISDYKNR